MNEKRIGVLDSYRFLAITLVILFHYYARWTHPLFNGNLYPYGSRFSNIITTNGTLGVQFFFIISGFVIYFSILRCHSFIEFLKKRFIRLYPPLLLCALITFVSIRLLDPSGQYPVFHTHLSQLLPSLTFTDPFVWNTILHRNNISYIDGAYWSLVVEVKFYLLAGILYFSLSKKERFIRCWSVFLVIVTALCGINSIPFLPVMLPAKLVGLFQTAFFYEFILFFSLGIYFYDYFINNKPRIDHIVPILMLLIFCYRHIHLWMEIVFIAIFISFFLCLIYNNSVAKILDTNILRRIGIASYTIYLLHQSLGVVLIAKYGGNFSSRLLTDLFPMLVYLFFIIVSLLIYQYYELPSKRALSHFFFKKKQ